MQLWVAWKICGAMVKWFGIFRAATKAYQAIKNLRTKTKAPHHKA